MKNEILMYQHKDLAKQIKVKLEEDTLWLTQEEITTLFDSSKANISEHIKHIFQTGELAENATVRKFRTVRKEGNRKVSRELLHYSLDVVISVGYRVNSIRGTQFRIWANQVLKEYLLKGYAINNRMNRIEDNVQTLTKKIEQISLEVNTNLKPSHGIFFNGEVYDAYTYVSDIFRSAKESIILIDNYIDDTVFTLLLKRNKNVAATIFTKNISKQLELDLQKHNDQYSKIKINLFKNSHDRFIIIDKIKLYHFGASLKDLGKKWFAFSRMDSMVDEVLKKLR